MKTSRIITAVLLSLITLSSGLADKLFAGPVPGKYRGNIVRIATAATPKVKVFTEVTATAKNTVTPGVAPANLIFVNGGGNNNRVYARVELLPSGKVKVLLKGSIVSRTDNRPVSFSSSFVATPTIGTTSISAEAQIPNFKGKPATAKVTTKTVGAKLVIDVEINVNGAAPGHPLRDYKAVFAGNKF